MIEHCNHNPDVKLCGLCRKENHIEQLSAENKMLKNRCTVLYRALDKLVRLNYGFFSTSTLQSYQDILDVNKEYK